MQNTLLNKKYYTIGEVTEITELPAYVIRFWEKNFPSIVPQKARGRRYYKKEDIDKLNLIKKMLYTDKLSIKAAQNILYRSSPSKPKIVTSEPLQTPSFSPSDFQSNLDNMLSRLNASRDKLASIL
ncbi:MAG: MerR family transcriptional regulator [Rickettsiaceae bacterium]|jgi:DNA-binding transcriptional MerR regulator|nr:MerR family transcriptional regulator [Rickettsiaceae bacterium]